MSGEDETAKPGNGWTNGSIPPSMVPLTRNGRLELYGHHRRWIGLTTGWTRIGKGSTEMDARHSDSQSGKSLVVDAEEESKSVKSLISQLCEAFFKNGWATGTGGGLSIRVGGPSENRPWRVFVAPSGLQKEDVIGDDIFELDMDCKIVQAPKTPNLRLSACTPLWYVVYRNRPTARCVIHSHSVNAQMATLLDRTEKSKTIRITHLEMLKGVGNHAYDDVLEVPIIDNRPTEDLLAAQLERVIQKYPKSNAVLVRRHGLYAWGDSWEQAKTQCESFDYIFESAIRMQSMGIDPGKIPSAGTYYDDDKDPPAKRAKPDGTAEEPPVKKAKPDKDDNGFRGKGQAPNQADVDSNTIPLLPKDSKILLLDIEGCTTSIAFVKEELFPYVLQHLDTYLSKVSDEELQTIYGGLEADFGKLPDNHPSKSAKLDPSRSGVAAMVRALMANDVKATGLKALQGRMWKSGYDLGEIKGHVYPDFVPTLEWCRSNQVAVYIYSSGSIQAQKLLFGNSQQGDLLSHIKGHFDTTSGSKKEAPSYQTIAKSIGVEPAAITFVSDAEAELVAAREAGVGNVVMSIRPGNVPITSVGKEFPIVHSLLQLCGV